MKFRITKLFIIIFLIGITNSNNLFGQQSLIVNGYEVSYYYFKQTVNNQVSYGYQSSQGAYTIGKILDNNFHDWEIYRGTFEFDISGLPENATLTGVKLNYSVTGYGNGYDTYSISDFQPSGPMTFSERWDAIESSSVIFNSLSGASGSNLTSSTLTNRVNNSITNGYFFLGSFSNDESSNDSYAITSITVTIEYTVPPTTVDISAENDMNGYNGGTIGAAINGTASSHTSPYSMANSEVGSTLNLLAFENQTYNGYNYIWNDTEAPNNKSEWHIVAEGSNTYMSNSRGTSHTIAESDDGAKFVAYLKRQFAITRDDDCTEFDNLLTDQQESLVVEQNNGTLTAPATKTVNSRLYNFVGWTDNFNASNPRTITPTDNEDYTALYKYPHHSNNYAGFSNVGSRRIVMTETTGTEKLWTVYESMGKVWLETSTDGGTSWSFKMLNGGDDAKNASLTTFLNTVLVAYQMDLGGGFATIRIDQFSSTGQLMDTEYVDDFILGYYSTNLYPLIEVSYAQQNEGTFLVIWKGSDGLYYRNGGSDRYTGLWWRDQDYYKVTGTTSSSSYPTMAVLKGSGYPKSYHLAYQEGTQQIRYIKIQEDYQHAINFSSVETPSYGSGFTYNKYPSIIVIDNNDPRVAWMGYNLSSANKTGLNKELIPEDAHRAVLRAKSGSTWSSTFFKWDVEVQTVNINRPDNNAYLLGWVTGTSTLSNKYIENTDIYDTHTFGALTGKYFQFSNGATKEDMVGISFENSSSPYALDEQEVDMSTQKASSSLVSYAREGIITKDSTQLYFRIADIILDNEKVSFVDDEAEEKFFTSIDDLNSYLESESFNLTDMSNLEYSVEFGSLNTTPAVNVFANGDYVRFKVELVDVQSNEVIGNFDNIEFNKNSVGQYSRTAYQVDCNGIDNKEVKLRLVVSENIGALYTAGNISADVDIIGKQNLEEVNFKGELPVKDYQLAQNYPNPFNPTTTISYAVKAPGMVTLKIYNTLGEEIRTLVNTAQQKGRYEVQFNASNLASGVYIYRLQVNDFTATKKLMLLK